MKVFFLIRLDWSIQIARIIIDNLWNTTQLAYYKCDDPHFYGGSL